MNGFCLWIGRVFCVLGGAILTGVILTVLAKWCVYLWTDVLWHFRRISEAERDIMEYRKDRRNYMRWKEQQMNEAKKGSLP